MFDAEDADFILRPTPPQIEFRVHRIILSVASSPFEAMLALPQPSSGATSELSTQPLPVVDVSENASTFRILLQMIYPTADVPTANTFRTIDELVSAFEAAFKYDVDAAIEHLRAILVSPKWLESVPLRVYAVAMRWNLEEEAKIASRYTLQESLLDSPPLPDFMHTSGYAFQRLVALHRTRSIAAQTIVESAVAPGQNCRSCSSSPAPWLPEWKNKAKEELALRPTTQVIFSLKFLGDTWAAVPPSNVSCNDMRNCERFKLWTPPLAALFESLETRIDRLAATI